MRTATSRHVHRSISFRSIEEASASSSLYSLLLVQNSASHSRLSSFPDSNIKVVAESEFERNAHPGMACSPFYGLLCPNLVSRIPSHNNFTFPTGKWLLEMIAQAQCSMQNLPCAPHVHSTLVQSQREPAFTPGRILQVKKQQNDSRQRTLWSAKRNAIQENHFILATP